MHSANKPFIMYVDDEEINLELFNLSFSKDFNIITAISGEEALLLYKPESIKMVITDYRMPGMNGMDLVKNIKNINPEAVCIIISGFIESEVYTDKSMIYKYMNKPWKKQELHNLICEVVS